MTRLYQVPGFSRVAKRPFTTLLALLATLAAACLDPVSSLLPPVPTGAPCVPDEPVSGDPITDPTGPLFHQILVGQTTDGRAVTGIAEVIDGGSRPDGVRLASGTVLIYFVSGADGAVWVARYTAGNIEFVSPISVNGVRAPAGVTDPDVQFLPNGDVRLAYVGGVAPPTEENPQAICIADSDDGVHFTVRSLALSLVPSDPAPANPSVLRLGESSWLLAFSQGNRTTIARSADGYFFTPDSTFNFGGVPELASPGTGVARIYVCNNQGITSLQSANAGDTWQGEGNVIPATVNGKPVCDPSFITGAGLFIFRTAG